MAEDDSLEGEGIRPDSVIGYRSPEEDKLPITYCVECASSDIKDEWEELENRDVSEGVLCSSCMELLRDRVTTLDDLKEQYVEGELSEKELEEGTEEILDE